MIIPAMGVAAAVAAVALGSGPVAALAMGVAGAAVAAVVRAFAGDTAAGFVGAAVAALLVAVLFGEHAHLEVRAALALAATAWGLAELTRPPGSAVSPLVAMAPAVIAALLDPAAVGLVAIAGARVVTELRPQPRWAIALPIAGGLAAVVAIIAGSARTGIAARLAVHWFAAAPAVPHGTGSTASTLAQAGLGLASALGPLVAVAALAGLSQLARVRRPELALVACLVGAILVDLRAGEPGATMLGLGAILAGLAVARFAAPVRLPVAQATLAATAGFLLLVPSTWSTVAHGPREAAAVRRSSR